MSDYEEEHFPVTIRTSFSSSFDGDWRESAGGTDFAPIRRSFSEFYRGERMTVDTVDHKYDDQFQNVSSKDDIQDLSDDNSDLDNFNNSNSVKLGAGSQYLHDSLESRSNQPDVDMPIDAPVSELSSINSECVNGYDSRDNSGTKSVSRAQNNEASIDHSILSPGTGLHSQHGNGTVRDVVHKRIVSEIRNNIPDVGNVKSCIDSSYEICQPSPDTVLRGEFARFRKRSPGVAKRLEATTPSQPDSVDMSVLSSADILDDKDDVVKYSPDSSSILTQSSTRFTGSVAAVSTVNVDNEEMSAQTESTKQHKYSNNADNLQMSRTWDSLSDDTVHRTDPFRYSGMLPDAVLFTTSDDPVSDQTIRLSPELTECDSDNVSALEEDNVTDVVNVCLPVVEDGLSCSDTDEMPVSVQNSSPPSNVSSAVQSYAVDVDVSHKFPVSETDVMDFFSGTADSSCDTTKEKDDPVERAIRDIRLAMERSKGFSTGRPPESQLLKPQSSRHDGETVWVSRAV